MKKSHRFKIFILYILLYLSASNQVFAQNEPIVYLSKNTVISIIQDEIIKSNTNPTISKYVFCAPSFCFVDDSTMNFTEIISENRIDHTKIDVLSYCRDMDSLRLTMSNFGYNNFIILTGSVSISNHNIKIILIKGSGSTDVLKNIAEGLSSNKIITNIALNDRSITYDQKLKKLNLVLNFSQDGIIIGQEISNSSLISKVDLKIVNRELQSTGVTSIGVFLPLEFVNMQFENLVIPYIDNSGTDIQLKNCKFSFINNILVFHTILSGRTIRNRTLNNQYQITAQFNSKDMTLETLNSAIFTGTNRQEASIVNSLVNFYNNQLRGKLIFTLPNQHYYDLKPRQGTLKLNVKTYYGHFFNGIFVFVNSFNLKR